MGQPEGRADTKGNPSYTDPMTSIFELTAHKSCNSRHFPDFFFITKMGVLHGDVDRQI